MAVAALLVARGVAAIVLLHMIYLDWRPGRSRRDAAVVGLRCRRT